MSDCSVCLDGESHYLTPCGHRLHLVCFWEAVGANSKCPICHTFYGPAVDDCSAYWDSLQYKPDDFYALARDATKTPEKRAAKIMEEDRLVQVGSRYIENLFLYKPDDVDLDFATAFVNASAGHRCGDGIRAHFLSWLVHHGLYERLQGLIPTSNRVKKWNGSLEPHSLGASEFFVLQQNKGWNIGLCQDVGPGGPRNLHDLLTLVPFPSAKLLVQNYLGELYQAPLAPRAT